MIEPPSPMEQAITRLEEAAATWFAQDLHRDLQTVILAARRSVLLEDALEVRIAAGIIEIPGA